MTTHAAFHDQLGPAQVIPIANEAIGLEGLVVIDNIALGPAMGGIRMARDVTAQEVRRLARAMTYKNAVADLPHGGGKAAIMADPKQPAAQKEQLIRAFARAIAPYTDYIPGPDMGTNEACMAWVQEEIDRVIGLPAAVGGIPLDEVGATGYGLAIAAEAASPYCKLELSKARMVIQGFGAVGQHAARFLAERGAILIGVCDSRGTLYNPDGLDIDALVAAKKAGRSVVQAEVAAKVLPNSDIVALPCDIWIPAARPDVVTGQNVKQLDTKLVLQGANIPFSPWAEKICRDRNILIVPDFIANAGGIICGSVEYHGGTQDQAFAQIEAKIRENTALILEAAFKQKQSPRTAAIALATARISRARKPAA